jgi:hypothetical protein
MAKPDSDAVTYGDLKAYTKAIMEFVAASIVDAPYMAGTERQLGLLRDKRLAFLDKHPDFSPPAAEVNAINGLTAVPDFRGK